MDVNAKQTLGRLVVFTPLFVFLFYNSVAAESFAEVVKFLLALIGCRAIAFGLFPHKEK